MTVKFRILGGLELLIDNCDHSPTAPKVRQVLALLVARLGRDVLASDIVAELWDDAPPASATTTMQTYIYQLRRIFEENRVSGRAGQPLLRRGAAYRLDVDPADVDSALFRAQVEQARTMAAVADYDGASRLLTSALSIWTGEPFAGVDRGQLLQAHAVGLDELRNRAIEMRIEADMQLGRHHELIPDLRTLCSEQPLNEWLHGKLIQALGMSGRRSDALAAYHRMRRMLDAELGLRPSAESRRLQEQLLNA
ncbi:MAG TPA: AfsR/SARP family transcriptional regulator [Jatrophihabitans sp.]|nr:AfsR/SARP family transcriptional regulator [Jatrophihabitans sp.]